MAYQSIYKQVIHQYEIDRNEARALYERRKQALYDAAPRIKEIDEELRTGSLRLARNLLSGVSGEQSQPSRLATLKLRNKSLLSEKRQLMEQNGYAPDYLTNVYKCALCQDTGYVAEQKCRCFKQRLIDQYYDVSNLRDVLRAENFKSFDFRFYSQETDQRFGISAAANMSSIYKQCVDFVLNFGSEFSNLMFYGNTGLGKTFLCNCIAKDLLDAGVTVLYVTAPRIFKKIEEFRFNRSEQEAPDEQLEMIYETDLLIIDDLGSEFSTVITNTELFNIINSRLLEKRPTIISTNLSLQDFQNAYTDRIVSRFIGNYEILRLFGDDIRIKKKLAGV